MWGGGVRGGWVVAGKEGCERWAGGEGVLVCGEERGG